MHPIDIVILANSKKHLGHCIAGKNIRTGEWVRLINYEKDASGKPCPFGETELKFCCGSEKGPTILSTIRIPFSDPDPLIHQPENVQIIRCKWVEIKKFPILQLPHLLDQKVPNWFVYSDGNKNDRIPTNFVNSEHPISQSLFFFRLFSHNKWKIIRYSSMNQKIKYRLEFLRFGVMYNLAITDYFLKDSLEEFYQEQNSDLKLAKIVDYSRIIGNTIFITVGLGEDFNMFHYKLIVGLIGVK